MKDQDSSEEDSNILPNIRMILLMSDAKFKRKRNSALSIKYLLGEFLALSVKKS